MRTRACKVCGVGDYWEPHKATASLLSSLSSLSLTFLPYLCHISPSLLHNSLSSLCLSLIMPRSLISLAQLCLIFLPHFSPLHSPHLFLPHLLTQPFLYHLSISLFLLFLPHLIRSYLTLSALCPSFLSFISLPHLSHLSLISLINISLFTLPQLSPSSLFSSVSQMSLIYLPHLLPISIFFITLPHLSPLSLSCS